MTTINTLDDFLQALDDNPTWRDAVRARILGEDVLQLPAKFDAFVEEQRAFVEEQRAFVKEQKVFNEQQKVFNEEMRGFVKEQKVINQEMRVFREEQGIWNRNATARFDRMERDMSLFKELYGIDRATKDVRGIAWEMGLEYVRTLSIDDLGLMAGNSLSGDVARSFRRADLVIEATDGNETVYIAMEISYTADSRDSGRAIRNAELITRFTGKPARAAVGSVRNDYEVEEMVESGAVYWYPFDDPLPRQE
jgi:hypothetical protein